MPDDYSAKDIMVLTGAQGIRKRPGMYIGSTGSAGFLHLLYEVIDNSIDESISGYCKNITIKLTTEDNTDVAEVSDDGRGIPVDIMAGTNKPALEVIMTSLHSGAKFNNKTYKVSGGLHGVGLTVVNALSEYTQVTVKKNGKLYKEEFSRGLPISSLEVLGDTTETGTTIKFKPDKEIFSVGSFDVVSLIDRLRDVTYLNPGLKITLTDARDEKETKTEFFSEKGITDFMDYIRSGKEEISKPILITKEVNDTKISVSIQYIKSYSEELLSFVNNIKTPEGGMHVSGFHSALTRAITSYVQKNVKKSNINIEGEDTREGLIGIISILMQNPEFEGQTKEKLGNTFVKQIVENAVYTELSYYLEENPAEAAKIVEKVLKASEAREAARRARELARKKSLFEGSVLPGKLADCTENDPSKSEIFIVEGDSAAGSSKQGRDRMYQAIMPLRGKVLNVEKASTEKIFNNAELHTLVTALGTGIKDSFNIENLRYHKIIFLTDADVDGSHIETLLLTFFYRYLKEVIERGYIYAAQPPLYKITIGKEVKYAYNDEQMNQILKENNGKGLVNRYKGLGEMNPDQLWETTMNPENRVLKKITIKDAELADSIFNTLMGANVEDRRKFLEAHSTEVSFLDV
ncbi:DNA gyrase subunit B [Candidatus Mancarchaeum acidiphilum]|uniref:DNA topoisomerase (ATP-hydrolyzing) n=2 Tax=Candidatus Mancarchaeum acidiphilum TaxID=1920749 RepID=A0A218NP27_9ARCH|nr:DNA gyrase subunit B [Candidatus Mancarchaeum acidiphilum]